MKISNKLFIYIIVIQVAVILSGCSQNNEIAKYEEPIELKYQIEEYANTPFPVLDENINLTEVNRFESDNIVQVLYTKEDDSSLYCYLEINTIKYDLGALNYIISPVENTESYRLEKTSIDYKNTIYKIARVEGAASLGYDYFTINDNMPTLLYTLYYSDEINNNDEIISVSSFGIPSYTCIYKWSSDGIYLCDINSFLGCDYANFYKSNMTIEIIKAINFNKPAENIHEFFNLIGDKLVPLN